MTDRQSYLVGSLIFAALSLFLVFPKKVLFALGCLTAIIIPCCFLYCLFMFFWGCKNDR